MWYISEVCTMIRLTILFLKQIFIISTCILDIVVLLNFFNGNTDSCFMSLLYL